MKYPLREARHKKILIKYSLRAAQDLPEGDLRDLFLQQASRLDIELAQVTSSAEYLLAKPRIKIRK